MAQAAHRSAPDIAGKGIANPVGMIRSSVMLMEWLGEKHGDPRLGEIARDVNQALLATLEAGIRTGRRRH